MSRFKKVFMGKECNFENEMQVTNTDLDEITIEIWDYHNELNSESKVIRLDVSTAIALSKELRRLINEAKELF